MVGVFDCKQIFVHFGLNWLPLQNMEVCYTHAFVVCVCVCVCVPLSVTSLTRWTWVWVNSRSWWWTGRPGVLRFMGSQRVRHDWATELNWSVNCRYRNCLSKHKWEQIIWHMCLYIKGSQGTEYLKSTMSWKSQSMRAAMLEQYRESEFWYQKWKC